MTRADLVALLELVAPALGADNDPVQLFQCFTFTGSQVIGYNDRLAIIAPCKTDEAFAVNGKVLLGLLKNSHSDEVDFTLTDKNDVTVKAGKSRFKLPYFPQEDFLFKQPTGKPILEIPMDDTLLPGLEACLITASRDLAQEALLGVALKAHDKVMAFYSCDGDAVTRFDLKAKAGDVTAQLPNEFCEALTRTAREAKVSFQALKIIDDEWAHAAVKNGISIYGRLSTPSNPLDHEELIAKTIKGKVTFKPVPKALDQALSRARIVADPESAKTELEIADGKLLLHTTTHMGDVDDSMVWREHPQAKADVSAALVQRAIGLCDEMAVLERCTVYRKQPNLFIVVSNMG
jgi:DNA polymerase III sliding clamp (beta) subunit (PCNA family)